MRLENYIQATIIKRYNRFIADIKLNNGKIVQAHVPNTGRMTGCWENGWKCIISDSNNPKRKYRYTLELTNNGKTWIVVNTNIPNKLAEKLILDGKIEKLANYDSLRREVKYGENSRIDILLEKGDEKCYVEVKNTTMVIEDTAYFPDAVSTRAIKHLKELIAEKEKGNRAVMLFMITREDAKYFSPAHMVDPSYAENLKIALEKGVEILPVKCKISPDKMDFGEILSLKI